MSEQLTGPEEKFSFWHELRNAVRGTEADYTRIPLNTAVFLLAIPMILELVMESAFAVVDIYFVGKLGASAVSTVGLTETYLFLLYSIAMGLSMAVTAIVARRTGEKHGAEAGLSAAQSVLLAVACSVPFALAGIFFAPELIGLMGGDEWSVKYGSVYTAWMLGGNFVIMLIFVINAVFRGAGDAAVAMKVLLLSNGLNIILDPLLIFGWGPIGAMGIEGAAVATNIGRGAGVLLQLVILLKGSRHLHTRLAHFRPKLDVSLHIIKTSLGGIGQMAVATTSWVFLMRILADISNEAVAGSTIALRIMMFTIMPAWGLSNAAATMVGQNLGAGRPDRAESSVWVIGTYNMAFLLVVSVIYFFFNRSLIEIFSSDPAVINVGAAWLKILSYSYFIYGWWMVSVQAFNGAGDTRTPVYLNIIFFWLIQIPISYLFAIKLNGGYEGVFWGVFLSETLVGIVTLLLFRRGSWKNVEV